MASKKSCRWASSPAYFLATSGVSNSHAWRVSAAPAGAALVGDAPVGAAPVTLAGAALVTVVAGGGELGLWHPVIAAMAAALMNVANRIRVDIRPPRA
ncbi:exported hypothetical protein [uncultured Mycobacterium sp.]|uniref:Uncharacterized protein n=1 Tax=uncultured Mycobacterium sp. TaxID=171292 RepID=A0A1Y5PMW2_9MYCO|nr:exported hypothetical protein [uncultured Mycobacterium sp.]